MKPFSMLTECVVIVGGRHVGCLEKDCKALSMESVLAEAHDHMILIFVIRVILGLQSGIFGTGCGLL